MIILPFFTNLTGEKLNALKNALDQFVAFNFPMRSDEFPKGTLKHNNYVDCTKKVSIFNKYIIRSQSELCLETLFHRIWNLKREILHSCEAFVFLGYVFIQKLYLQKHTK